MSGNETQLHNETRATSVKNGIAAELSSAHSSKFSKKKIKNMILEQKKRPYLQINWRFRDTLLTQDSGNVPGAERGSEQNIRFPIFATETLVDTRGNVASGNTGKHVQYQRTRHQRATISRR